jgi:hypothetical protein
VISVTIEMIPRGVREKRETLATITIANETPGRDPAGYSVWVDGKPCTEVEKHPRASGFWPLVAKAIANVLKERSK